MTTSNAWRTLAAIAAAGIAVLVLGGAKASPEQANERTATRDAEPVSEQAVRDAIESYVRAKYAGDEAAVRSRAHHDIARRRVEDQYWGEPSDEWVRPYGHDNLKFYGTRYNETRREDPATGRCEIRVFDVESRTASAVVVMEDVVDYLHMIHFDGRWLIADSAVILLDKPGQRPPAQRPTMREEIEQVLRDYCVGFYELDGEKVQGTCHPILSKRSIEHAPGTDFDFLRPITWEEIRILGETFNKGFGFDPATARCEIEVYEVRGNVAAAKLTGTIWFDYFQLLRVNGEWKIVNIMFEPLPEARWSGTGG